MRFLQLAVEPAICRIDGAADRCSADRVLIGHREPPAPSTEVAAAAAPGRVTSGGRFRDPAVHLALTEMLPAPLARALRAEFEWYACRGAFFHNDAHYGAVLFGAWCAAGPARELVFARARLRVGAAPGDWVVFDPFEPHAVLDCDEPIYRADRYVDAAASVFVGFELALDDAVRARFGIGAAPARGPLLASSVAINPETGALR